MERFLVIHSRKTEQIDKASLPNIWILLSYIEQKFSVRNFSQIFHLWRKAIHSLKSCQNCYYILYICLSIRTMQIFIYYRFICALLCTNICFIYREDPIQISPKKFLTLHLQRWRFDRHSVLLVFNHYHCGKVFPNTSSELFFSCSWFLEVFTVLIFTLSPHPIMLRSGSERVDVCYYSAYQFYTTTGMDSKIRLLLCISFSLMWFC